jgi:hypothetical protein
MAKKIIETVTDDLDGSVADHTIQLGWEGEWRELDLNQKNLDALAKVFDRYWDAARPQPSGSARSSRRRGAPGTRQANRDFDLAQLREWAGRNGVGIPQRGRIPRAVVEQYKAAGGR